MDFRNRFWEALRYDRDDFIFRINDVTETVAQLLATSSRPIIMTDEKLKGDSSSSSSSSPWSSSAINPSSPLHGMTSNPLVTGHSTMVSVVETQHNVKMNANTLCAGSSLTAYQRLTLIYANELQSGPVSRSSSEALLGWTSGFINICVTFPLNKMIFRQQLHGFTAKSAIRQLVGEGIGNVYRGVLPPLIQKSTSVAIMFGSFDKIKSSLHQSSFSSSLHPFVTVCSAAVLAGWCEAVLMPFERIQTLLQDSSQMRQFKNTKDAFMRLPAEYSFSEYYRGLTPILIRNGLSNAFFFSLRTPISLSTQELGAPKLVSDFASGAMLGAFISTVMYPLNTVKTHMQINLGKPFRGIVPTLRLVLAARNGDYRKLFRGVHLNLTRALISWGIINMSYEYLKHIFLDDSPRWLLPGNAF